MSKIARYVEVANILEQRIQMGLYQVGNLLPTEAALCEEFSISRFTARNALKQLEEVGKIERQQGKGSVVLADRPVRFNSTWSTIDELIEHANQVRVSFTSVKTVFVDAELSAKTGFNVGSKLSEFKGVRFGKSANAEIPLCSIVVWIDAKYASSLDQLDNLGSTIISWLKTTHQLEPVEVRQKISAQIIGDDLAKVLKTDSGIAGLNIKRTYLDKRGVTIEATTTVFPSYLFEYETTISSRN
ncbi:GntR family transcriptional regulator [Marinomonas sp. RS-M-Aa-14]|uniref:GntR family transcriptional regulator n=1 Tax=Marinomonas sp. RS-M-Aa-14 TaxID=3241169 RepID=UPI00390C6802